MGFGFGKKKKAPKPPSRTAPGRVNEETTCVPDIPKPAVRSKFELSFSCQLAHGGPTCVVRDFRNIKELYIKMAEVVGIDSNKILFVTVNTGKVGIKNKFLNIK